VADRGFSDATSTLESEEHRLAETWGGRRMMTTATTATGDQYGDDGDDSNL
jgi:hypothetical protein